MPILYLHATLLYLDLIRLNQQTKIKILNDKEKSNYMKLLYSTMIQLEKFISSDYYQAQTMQEKSESEEMERDSFYLPS